MVKLSGAHFRIKSLPAYDRLRAYPAACAGVCRPRAGCNAARGGRGGEGEGNFEQGPGNQNPPPGSIGAGGGQGNVVAICHNGHTIFVSPQGAENLLRTHPGDTLGPCVVTPVTNQ